MATEALRAVCARCQGLVREGRRPATHTICPECMKRMFGEQDKKERA